MHSCLEFRWEHKTRKLSLLGLVVCIWEESDGAVESGSSPLDLFLKKKSKETQNAEFPGHELQDEEREA